MAIAYSPLNSGEFTTKMLDANFGAIAQYTQQTEDLLLSMAKAIDELAGAHELIAKKVAKLPKKRRVLPFVVGAGVGIYVYKRLKKSGLSVEFDAQTGSLRAQKPAETTPKETNENQDFGRPTTVKSEDVHEG
jgi:hypothetical protein